MGEQVLNQISADFDLSSARKSKDGFWRDKSNIALKLAPVISNDIHIAHYHGS